MKRIYIFSGLLSSVVPSFREGTNEIAEILRKEYPQDQVVTMIWNKWEDVADKIYQQYAKEGYKDKVILIGHSNGVKACALIVDYLSVMGIDVDYVGAIDPTAAKFPRFLDNVKVVDEFYASSGYPALMRKMTNNKRGACRFSNVWHGLHRILRYRATHIGVSSEPDVHQEILNSIKKLD